MVLHKLPMVSEILVVCAHPDDESFGLGAVIGVFVEQGTRVRLVSLTHGEASTLGWNQFQLGEIRTKELEAAAKVLGVRDVKLYSYADNALGDLDILELAEVIHIEIGNATAMLVFDIGGITGHLDHCRATEAALQVGLRREIPVLAWTIPSAVADQLNAEFETSFVGRSKTRVDFEIDVDRSLQEKAIRCHLSQSRDNPVLWRRLQLLGNKEYLCWLT